MGEIVSLQQRQFESIENLIAIEIKDHTDLKLLCQLDPYKLTDIVAVLALPQLVHAGVDDGVLECAVMGLTTTEERLLLVVRLSKEVRELAIAAIQAVDRKLKGGGR